MICVIQRVDVSEVIADGVKTGGTQLGLLVLCGVKQGDNEDICDKMAEKLVKMRVFEDENGKMNLSCADVGASVLVVSNFTLCASCRRGTRPDFFSAEKPERANELYERFVSKVSELGIHTESGVFGADMRISAQLNGPVTIILDSEKDIASR